MKLFQSICWCVAAQCEVWLGGYEEVGIPGQIRCILDAEHNGMHSDGMIAWPAERPVPDGGIHRDRDHIPAEIGYTYPMASSFQVSLTLDQIATLEAQAPAQGIVVIPVAGAANHWSITGHGVICSAAWDGAGIVIVTVLHKPFIVGEGYVEDQIRKSIAEALKG